MPPCRSSAISTVVSTATPTAPPSMRENDVSAVAIPTCCSGTAFCVATSPLGSCRPIASPSTTITSAHSHAAPGSTNASARIASGATAAPAICSGL
ncbi:hypothetical protein D3C72_2018930 [compost metagenome]